jgi:N-acetylglucosamine malate deacetylase 1
MSNKDKKRVLVIAPHPDDEVLGCGGISLRYAAEGHDVSVLVMSRGKPGRYTDESVNNVRGEALRAHKELGVKKTFFLDYSAPELDLHSVSELAASIGSVIKDLGITVLYVPHRGDIHHDHRAVYNAALVASRPTGGCTISEIYAYETLSETEWAAPFGDDAFIPTCFVDISDYMDSKLRAMQCYKSQVRELPSSRSIKAIEALAQYRGVTVGCFFSEAFMHVRTIMR